MAIYNANLEENKFSNLPISSSHSMSGQRTMLGTYDAFATTKLLPLYQ
jgi:hypothetical protein